MSDVTLHPQGTPEAAAQGHAHHHPFLQHHFEDLGQQHEASTLGLWVFVAEEILFFGGLFAAYAVYRMLFPEAWSAGAHHQNWIIGTANTAVLIGSSLTMALAVWAAQTGRRMLTVWMLIATLFLGTVFIGVKGYEYYDHIHHGLLPGSNFTYVHQENPALTPGIQLFMVFYFTMTGLHALHMIVGLGVMAVITYFAWRGSFTAEYNNPVDMAGLYWHFVDLVWVFLFPTLYLLGGIHL